MIHKLIRKHTTMTLITQFILILGIMASLDSLAAMHHRTDSNEDHGLSSGTETTPRPNPHISEPVKLRGCDIATQTTPSIHPCFTNPASITKECRIARYWIFLSNLLGTETLSNTNRTLLINDLQAIPYSIAIDTMYDYLNKGYAEYFAQFKEQAIQAVLGHLKLIVGTVQDIGKAGLDESDTATLWSMINSFVPDQRPQFPASDATRY